MASADNGLTYLAHVPAPAANHPPLIVLLHGAGADERDMIGLWHDLPKTLVVVSPRAPFGDGNGYRWYRKSGTHIRTDDLAISAKVLDLVVDNAVKRFGADPHRVFLAGFSQGGVMVYEAIIRDSGRFRGAAVLSGSLSPSAAAALSKADRTTADVARTPLFIAHGTADTRIPLSAATAAQAALTRLGVKVTFHAYAGMGHTTGAAEIKDLADWLARLEGEN